MDIRERFTQVKAVAVQVAGFIRRHPRASIAAAVALVIVGPLLTGAGGGAFFVNLVGPGHHRPGGAPGHAGQRPAQGGAGVASGLPVPLPSAATASNSTTGRHAMTTVTLEFPSTTGRLEEVMD